MHVIGASYSVEVPMNIRFLKLSFVLLFLFAAGLLVACTTNGNPNDNSANGNDDTITNSNTNDNTTTTNSNTNDNATNGNTNDNGNSNDNDNDNTTTGSTLDVDVETITLERQPCFGFCPIYTLTIHGDGRVEYNGAENVEVTGPQTANIDPPDVQALANALIQGGYMGFEDAYMTQDVTDMPTVITSITFVDGTTKRIEHYYGDQSAPEELTQLEDLIDTTANVAQWVGTTD